MSCPELTIVAIEANARALIDAAAESARPYHERVSDAIAALPPLVARFFFAPRGGPKAPPLLGRCFNANRLAAPRDVREACLRGAANSFRFRAEYRWAACAVGYVAGFAADEFAVAWLMAEAACVLLARAPPAVAFGAQLKFHGACAGLTH